LEVIDNSGGSPEQGGSVSEKKMWVTPGVQPFGGFAAVTAGTAEEQTDPRHVGKRCAGTDGLGTDVNQCGDGGEDPVVS
jgi:hypothetical protein